MLSCQQLKILITFLLIFLQIQVWAETDRYRCMWRDNPATTMVIGWDLISGNNTTIYYDEFDAGNDIRNYSFSQKPNRTISAKGMNNQFARLSNLKPNTIYYFIIKDSEGTSRKMSFQTAPDNPYQRLSIIAGGDSRNHRTARKNANLLVSKLRPHAVMFGGDMTGGDNARQWKAWMDDWQLTMTTDGKLTPIIPARGNHESSNKSIVNLFDVKNKKIHYGLTFGGNLLRVYTLNSMIAAGGDQKIWLENDLRENTFVKWKFAQYHHAIRPHNSKKTERNAQQKNWANLFYQYGLDLACESDSHVAKTTYPVRPSKEKGSDEGYIRDDKNGTVYIGEGCWGAPLRRNDDDKKWTRASGSFNQFKWIFVDIDGIEIRTIKVDNAKEVAALKAIDIFSEPSGLDVWAPATGRVIRIGNQPVYANNPTPNREPLVKKNTPKRTQPKTKTKSKVKTRVAKQKKAAKKNAPSRKLFSVKPIEIYNFKAKLNAGKIVLEWMTKNESIIPTFEIQRSFDGRKYTTFARVHGNGKLKSGNENFYRVNDKLTKSSNGVLPQYRLRHLKRNGEARLFQAKIAATENPKWNDFDKLKTDPKTGQIQFKYNLPQPANVSIKLVNESQQQVLKNEFKNTTSGNFLQSIDVSDFEKGDYLLIIEADQEVIQQYKFIN